MSYNDILDSTARFLYNIFSDKYCDSLEKMLASGGGGNSMFVNAWVKPSALFIKARISTAAVKRLEQHGYSLQQFLDGKVPHQFLHDNAKTIAKRHENGKELHGDHNPGNVKVLHLIRDRVRSYKKTIMVKQKINDLKKYIAKIQTLDFITIEQDFVRTHKDKQHTKSEKDMMTAEQRDMLLNDTWQQIDLKNKAVY
jgi:hypothetical protein